MGFEAKSKHLAEYKYSPQERDTFYNETISKLAASDLVEGIVQIGSGVVGYNDEYSDIDLMVSTAETGDVELLKDYVHKCLAEFSAIYIKDKKHGENVYIIIAVLNNGLEFNISTLPTPFLSVRSPLWKVVIDRTGRVTEEMNSQVVNYDVNHDISFEFVFNMRRFQIELKRKNLIYAMKMLEIIRECILTIEALNEEKKLHQFKAYETLSPGFVEAFLNTYPGEITVENLSASANKLIDLFLGTVHQSKTFSVEEQLIKLLNESVKM